MTDASILHAAIEADTLAVPVAIRNLIRLLFAVNIVLACAYILTSSVVEPGFTLRRLFDMDAELSVCSWYSSSLLLLSAICWIRLAGIVETRALHRVLAAGMALFLLAASLDETAAVHEVVARKAQDAAKTPFEFTGPLFLAAIPALAICYFCWRLWPWRGSSAVTLFGGMVVMIFSATFPEALANFIPFGSTIYKLEVMVEETGEMMGMTMILLGSYDQLVRSAVKQRPAFEAVASL